MQCCGSFAGDKKGQMQMKREEAMEEREPLLEKRREGEVTTKWEALVGEVKKMSYIAMPMVAVSVSQYLLQAACMMMLGHLGTLALSSAAIATSFCNATGFTLLSGMACALETVCGQAYGAKQYQKLGTYTYGAIIWLSLACIPVSVLWIYTEKILILTGQDSVISAEAAKYSIWLIPSLFPFAILQCLVGFLQTQSLILPMVFSSIATLCIHLPLSWALIFKLQLGSVGAALSTSVSYWLSVIFLGVYVKYSSQCAKTRAAFSKDVFYTMGVFFGFAIPSAAMICLEWWAFEIVIFLGGLLPDPVQETSVLSICLTIASIHYHVPFSFGAAASTRISNELGAGKAGAAQVVVSAALFLAAVECVIASSVVLCCRHILGSIFSKEKEVIEHVKEMAPLVSMMLIWDALHTSLSGVARGSGWQHVGAYVNLGAYYVVGVPLAIMLGFVMHWKGQGLWCGMVAAAATQSLLLGIITARSHWDNQAIEARRRIFHQNIT